MMNETVSLKSREVPGPGLFEFFKGSGDFPAFHFYELMKAYGDIVKCGPYFYLINHPEMAKNILNRDQKDFSQEDFIGRRVKTVFGHGMVTSKGKLWRSQRRLLNPVFSHKTLHKSMDTAIIQIDHCLSEWEELSCKGDEIDLADLTGTLTIKTAGRLLFDYDFSEYVSMFKSVVRTGTNYIAEGLPLYLPLWVPSPNHLKLKKINRQVDDILEKVVESMACGHSKNESMGCVLKNALGSNTSDEFNNRVMLDEMRTMLAGGYFPVTCSLSMIWYCLGKHPEYLDSITEEIRQKPNDFDFNSNFYKDFPKTTAAIFEAMRLYPVAFSIWRKAKVDFKTMGYTIPKDKSVCISLFNLHRHPDFWDEADTYKPERFLNSESKTRPKHQFMPFGWGNRKCIGDHYAIMIIFLTVIKTLQRFNMKIVNEPLKVRRAALICPIRVMARIDSVN